jgi:hypothetical protein
VAEPFLELTIDRVVSLRLDLSAIAADVVLTRSDAPTKLGKSREA